MTSRWDMSYRGVELIQMNHCPCCGSVFYVPYQSRGGGKTNWIYSVREGNKRIKLCSYHCYRDYKLLDLQGARKNKAN